GGAGRGGLRAGAETEASPAFESGPPAGLSRGIARAARRYCAWTRTKSRRVWVWVPAGAGAPPRTAERLVSPCACVGSVSALASPSPKSQRQACTTPTERFRKVTLSGVGPLRTAASKSAFRGFPTG